MERKEIPFNFNLPEYYMEIKGHDVRLSILKLRDFSDTLGLLASYSLMYTGVEEYEHFKKLNETQIKCLRRIYLNNAILWYSNCFDILLQSIWFMNRVWQQYNSDGNLYKKYHKFRNRSGKDFIDIKRNIDGWVKLAEHNCEYRKVEKYFIAYDKKSEVYKKLKNFNNTYIKFNGGTKPNIRTLANQIKHNSSLKLKEFELKTTFNIKTDNPAVDKFIKSKDSLRIEYNQPFYNKDNPEEKGKITAYYDKDFLVDIKYDNSTDDEFRGQDLLEVIFSISEIENELNKYHDDIIDLYETIKESFKDNIGLLPSINLDEHNGEAITIHQPSLLPYLEDVEKDLPEDEETKSHDEEDEYKEK